MRQAARGGTVSAHRGLASTSRNCAVCGSVVFSYRYARAVGVPPPAALGPPRRRGVVVVVAFENLKFTGLTHNFPVDPAV